MRKCVKNYMENRIFIWALIIGLFFQLVYLSISSTNVPLMDYWKYINMFVEKMNTGGLAFTDIWKNDGIHRSPLQFIYFIINVRVFHLNGRVEICLGAILMAVIIIVLYQALKRDLYVQRFVLCGISGIGLVIITYNLNQWELLNEQFALSFASRLFLFLLGFILTNRYLQNIENNKKYTWELGVFYVIIIESVGGGYFPAFVASVGFVIVLHYFLRYREDKNKFLKEYILLVFFLVMGTFIYLHGIMGEASVINTNNIGIMGFIKNFILGAVTMLGVSIIGFDHSQQATIIIGSIVLILYLLAFIIYLRKKYYKKTYVPVAFMGYSAGALGIIYMGRMNMYGLDYAYSSRYVCETNIALLGFFWIVILYISELIMNAKVKSNTVLKCGVAATGCVIMLCGVILSDYKEWNIAPYRKIYGNDLIEKMYRVEELEDTDFSVFQAEKDNVINGVDIMKKYNLGVFYYDKK